MTQIGARMILLNRLLERYGPETKEIRERMSKVIATSVEQLWPSSGQIPSLAGIEQTTGMDDVHDMIVKLRAPGRSSSRPAVARP